MPPGVQPPIILRFNASSVPILQMSLSSDQMSESDVYDYGLFRIRTQLSTVQGLTMPTPYGGKERQVMVDLESHRAAGHGLSAREVTDAINLTTSRSRPAVARIADTEYPVTLNNSPSIVERLNDIPIKIVNGATIYMRDVAQVRDGTPRRPPSSARNGSRGTLLTILQNGNASTLDIVNRVKKMMPDIKAARLRRMKIDLLFDQSLFVTRAIDSVVHESIIAGMLTGAMILLFLGSWRSTLIVLVSIPLSILSSIAMLNVLGHSLNVMTLGGLALAVGILVDDATVEIENIHRNLGLGKPLRQAILDGAQQIAGPTFVSTLTISIVFVSVLFLEGPPKYPVHAARAGRRFRRASPATSSRTIVPALVDYLLAGESHAPENATPHGFFGRIHSRFNDGFERFRSLYVNALAWALGHRLTILAAFGILLGSGFIALPLVGRDFFPTVDTGQFRLHVVARQRHAHRADRTIFSAVEDAIREIIPREEVEMVLDNIGLPNRTTPWPSATAPRPAWPTAKSSSPSSTSGSKARPLTPPICART